MKKVVSIILLVCIIFNLTSCIDTTVLLENRMSSLIKQYEKTSTDELLVKIVTEALTSQEYAILQKYGEIFFFEKDASKMYNLYSKLMHEYLSINEKQVTKEDIVIMYEALLWHFIFTYFYDLDNGIFSPEYSKVEPIFDKCLPLFKRDKDKYFYSTAYTQFFNDAEKLTETLYQFLYRYSISCKEDERYDIFYFLSMEYGQSGNSKYKELFFSLWWYKKQNSELGKYESGDGIIQNDLEFVKAFSGNLNNSEDLYYNELNEYFNVKPKVVKDSDNVMFLYSSKNHLITYYGTPIYAVVVYDLQNNEICYYKSKIVGGSVIES